MERLTQPGQDFERQFCQECGCTLFGEPDGCNHPNGSCPSYCYFTTVAEQLAAYEDTGLTPQDVVDLMGNHGMALSELAMVPKWIPVTEKLPEQGQEVIVYDGGVQKPKVFAYQFWNEEYDSWARVTHWMPLPATPRKEGV